MRLNQKDRSILHHAQLQADQPVSVLRKSCPFQEHTVRYVLQQARKNGLIQQRCFIDLCRLGYSHFEIFFSHTAGQKNAGRSFLDALVQSERVVFLGELGGDYQYGVTLCVKSNREISDFLDQLSEEFGEIFLEKAVATRLALYFFGNKYLAKEPRTIEYLQYRTSNELVEIDETDHVILFGLINQAPRSRRQLAQQLGIPLSTVEYRIRRLEERKVIVGHYYHFNPQLLGMQSFLLLVGVKGIHGELKQTFWEFCKKHPNIVILIHCLGNWDFEIVVDVERSNDIIAVTQEIRDELGLAFNFTKVLPFFSYRKVAEYPFSANH